MAVYHYYLAKSGITHGPDPEILAKLKKTYETMFPAWMMTQVSGSKSGHYDGASLMPDGRVVVIVGNNGTGTGQTHTLDVNHG